jgi:cystathionine gamma-synthase
MIDDTADVSDLPASDARPARTEHGFSTMAIHAGQDPDAASGAVVAPITLSTTFAQQRIGEHAGYEYSRSGNPNRAALETCIAALERGLHGFAYASGLAAEDNILHLVRPGERIILGNDAYGGTFRLIDKLHSRRDVDWVAVDLTDTDALEAALSVMSLRRVAMVWLETPTNPTLSVIDIAAVARVAHRHGVLVVVDNTFATPYLQQPLNLGADIVVHSATKYLGGHSDVIAGLVVVNDHVIADELRYTQNAAGAVLSPFDSYMLLRGMKTLAVRMQRHCENAAALATWLESQPQIETVYYPGLSSHLNHSVACTQMRQAGGMISVVMRGGEAAARQFVETTTLFTLAESLGAVESLIEHPASMTHASASGSPLEVDPALVRLSVGIEDLDDLLEDLKTALQAID